MSEWEELRENWKALEEELEREMAPLAPREVGVIVGFYREVEQDVLTPLQHLEERIKKEGSPNPPVLADVFKSILGRFYTLASSGPLLAGELQVRLLNRIWHSAVEALTSFLERQAEKVGVESWSLGATVGFPSGVSGTVMVTFRREKAS